MPLIGIMGLRALCGRERCWRWGSLVHGYCSQTHPLGLQSPPADASTADEQDYVSSWVQGSLGYIKLNRPQALNAMTLGALFASLLHVRSTSGFHHNGMFAVQAWWKRNMLL